MPISRQDFQRGATEEALSQRVWEFLVSHQNQAFTAEEVAVEVGHVRPADELRPGILPAVARGILVNNLQNLLSRWTRQGLLDSSFVDDGSGLRRLYFSIRPGSDAPTRW